MALIDDIELLRRHIRNTFITSDDSGTSEMVLDTPSDENLSSGMWSRRMSSIRRPSDRNNLGSNTMGSYDMFVASEDIQNQKQAKMKRVASNYNQHTVIPCDMTVHPDPPDFFKPIRVPGTPPDSGTKFSTLMSKTVTVRNPYVQYSRYDAQGQVGSTIKLRIHLTMCSSSPMELGVMAKATVEQTIGLILFQYCFEGREPFLSSPVQDFCLRHKHFDDDDDTLAFHPLVSKDPIHKYSYGYGSPALELSLYKESTYEKTFVKIHFDNKTWTVLKEYENRKVKMKEIFEKVIEKRKMTRSMDYVLEKLNEPGKAIDLSDTVLLEDMNTLDFRLIRNHCKRDSTRDTSGEAVSGYTRLQSLSYDVFRVKTQSKFLKKIIDVQLGISGEKIEIDPLTKTTLPPFKMKAESIDCQYLLGSEILDSSRRKLKITYLQDGGCKEYYFEAEVSDAEIINKKIIFIVNALQSKYRMEWLIQKSTNKSSLPATLDALLSRSGSRD